MGCKDLLQYGNVNLMTEEKRPRGRPATGNARSKSLPIRLTEAEYETLERAAGDAPVSTWMRETSLRIARRKTD